MPKTTAKTSKTPPIPSGVRNQPDVDKNPVECHKDIKRTITLFMPQAEVDCVLGITRLIMDHFHVRKDGLKTSKIAPAPGPRSELWEGLYLQRVRVSFDKNYVDMSQVGNCGILFFSIPECFSQGSATAILQSIEVLLNTFDFHIEMYNGSGQWINSKTLVCKWVR